MIVNIQKEGIMLKKWKIMILLLWQFPWEKKNTGGYSIIINDIFVIYEVGHVIIYVEEVSPRPGQIVTQAITYPCIKIKFDKKPDRFYIKNCNITDGIFEEIEIWYYINILYYILFISLKRFFDKLELN